MLFINEQHPLAHLPDPLGRDDFVVELRRRLRVPRLFGKEAREHGERAGGAGLGQGEPMLTVEECENLFDILLQMQRMAGTAHSNPGSLSFGYSMDATVESFLGLCSLRKAMERGTPSLNAFLGSLEVQEMKLIDPTLMRQFLVQASHRLAGEGGLPGAVPVELIVKAHSSIDVPELRRRLALAAPVGAPLLEFMGHFEVKHGFGRSHLHSASDFVSLWMHCSGHEHLDVSPQDVANFFRIFGGSSHVALMPEALDEALRRLPLEAQWGAEPLAVDRLFCALGGRCLQLERAKRKDASLPAEAVLEILRKDTSDVEKAESVLVSEDVLTQRFDQLWNNCVGESLMLALPPDGDPAPGHEKEKAERAERRKEQEILATQRMKQACLARFVTIGQELSRQVTRRQYESIFPNISDVLAVSLTTLRSGQVVIVRYRLAGACNFWHPKHRVLRDEREPVPWPVPQKVLGETPFIALVPRGLRWTNAGGGGFYLGSQSFNEIDPGLRADLQVDRDGKLLMYGAVELVAPFLLRGQRRTAVSAEEELEFRLFSSRKNRIIGCIGEPLRVQVIHQVLPPPVVTLQVCCDGPRAKLRWTGFELDEKIPVDVIRLRVKTDRRDDILDLNPETTQHELSDLLPDTDYEFHLRLESQAGAGGSVSCSCRTNARCSAPLGLSSAGASTTHVDLQWKPPQVLGNERTADRWQLQCEEVRSYEAQLSIAEEASPSEKRSRSLSKSRSSALVDLPVSRTDLCRRCRWEMGGSNLRSQSSEHLTGRLGGLRPDTLYSLEMFCAVNSMGAGTAARELQFWTMPLNPIIDSIRVRQGLVVLTLGEVGGGNVREFEVLVKLEGGEEKSFLLEEEKLRRLADGLPELPLQFKEMPDSSSSDAEHFVKMRARNLGGWSTWSEEVVTSSIARQQGADNAQRALEQAMERRVPEDLMKVLKDVRDIEFDDKTLVSEATELLETLQAVQTKVGEAMLSREPEHLQHVLGEAHKVALPGLQKAEALLHHLQTVCKNLDTAKGIDALRAALRDGHEARLPAAILQRAVQRLGTREAAQQGLDMAMEAARVPVLRAALDTAKDMHLPSEEGARSLLEAITHSENLLQASLISRDIRDLQRALDSSDKSGLREDELIMRAQKLLARQIEARDDAAFQLKSSMEARFPAELQAALETASASQVDQQSIEEGTQLLRQLERLLADIAAAVEVEQRTRSLQASKDAKVPPELLAAAELQLARLKHLHQVLRAGDVPATRRALRLAEVAGCKDQELAEPRAAHLQWSVLARELDIAVSIGETDRIRAALDQTAKSGICQAQLQPAIEALEAFKRSDAAVESLSQAMDSCDAELIYQALHSACQDSVTDSELLAGARSLLDRLLGLRQQLTRAMESMDLQRLHQAVVEAEQEDGLPEKDLASALKSLEDLKEEELSRLERHLKQASEVGDFRSLDGLLRRAALGRDLGVEVERLDLERHEGLVVELKEAHIRMIQDDIHKQQRRDWPAVLDVIPREEEGAVPELVEVVQLPCAIVCGGVSLDLYPRGIQEEFITLPWEIVEAKVQIPLPTEASGVEPVQEARESCDDLLQSISAILSKEDSLRRIGGMEIEDDGAYRNVTLPIAIFLSKESSCRDIIEAFFREPMPEAEAPEAEADEGRLSTSSRSLRRSKSFSKRRAIRGLWQSLRELGSHVPGSHCLQEVRGRVLRRMTVELCWTQPSSYTETMDATCIAMGADGVVEVVNARGFHGAAYGVDQTAYRLQSKGVDSLFGAISHQGTERQKGTDLQSTLDKQMLCKQLMQVRLDLLPERVTDLFFVLAATNSRELSKFQHLGFRVVDSDIGANLAHKEDHRLQLTFEAVVIMCAIYKLGDGYWRIGSMDVTCSGSPRDLKTALMKLEELGFPRKHERASQEHIVLEAVRKHLELPRQSVKPADVHVDSSNCMHVQYAIEVTTCEHEELSDASEAMAKGFQLKESLEMPKLKEAILEEMLRFTNEKVKPERLRILPVLVKPLGDLRVEVRWEFGEVKRTDNKDHSYLDGTLITFAGRSLQEIIDYRGAHGVRVVHNGVVDYDGVWVGPVGVSDASDGAIKHRGLVLDELPRSGTQTFEVQLEQLPPSTTDIFVVVSSPSGKELSKYNNITVILSSGHQVSTCLLKSKPSSPGVVFCRLFKQGTAWKLGACRSPTSGGCHDFRPAIDSLRAIQAQTHPSSAQISLGDESSRQERRFLPLQQVRSKGMAMERQLSTGSVSSLIAWSSDKRPNARRFSVSGFE